MPIAMSVESLISLSWVGFEEERGREESRGDASSLFDSSPSLLFSSSPTSRSISEIILVLAAYPRVGSGRELLPSRNERVARRRRTKTMNSTRLSPYWFVPSDDELIYNATGKKGDTPLDGPFEPEGWEKGRGKCSLGLGG